MKKLYLLLILSLLSAQAFTGSCPDGSDPIKSVSDDGTYYVYKCGGGNTNKANSATETSSKKSTSSVKGSEIKIYEVAFSQEVLEELLGRVISKTDYNFSKYKLATNVKDLRCSFKIQRVVYDKSELGIMEPWAMAKGAITIQDSNVEFTKGSSWDGNMGGLSSDPSYLQDQTNIKLTEDGHLVGKMAYFNLSVKPGETPLNPLYVTLTKHKRSKPINLKSIGKPAELWIDIEDWAGGIMRLSNCKYK